MDMKPGDVVILKSGGQPMTVAKIEGATVTCVWMGDEGDLFRETLPLAVLDPIEQWALEDEDGDDEDDDDDDDNGDEDEEDDDEEDEEDDDDEEEEAENLKDR